MPKVRIDIVSDVVCPWCIIGYKRLELALMQLSETIEAELHWHPFELNPAMKSEGQNLREHLAEKYGTPIEASQSARETLTQLGKELGFEFNFSEDMRIYNTRKAHQLLMWAKGETEQFELELALFHAYFTDGLDINNDEVLLNLVESVDLDREIASKVLYDSGWSDTVASTERQWLEAGINAVPAIIINRKHLISGAQNTDVLVQALTEITKQNDEGLD
ncbi:DsbA family oxidoreductase [Vibrio sp. TRT 17S01]|uniref:DsbA family oxidoreductase n=1 Tax=Vibrio sp. TRT 17S01 TaxID=3418505 RepID=UPI003CFB0C9D